MAVPFDAFRFSACAIELDRAILELEREVKDREIRKRYGVRYYTWEDHMSTPISRLKDKLGKAAGVAQRMASAIEAEADELIAQEDVIKAKTTDAFAPHKAILAEAGTELQAIKDALNLMSNGGPALDPLHDAAPTAQGLSTASVTLNEAGVIPEAK